MNVSPLGLHTGTAHSPTSTAPAAARSPGAPARPFLEVLTEDNRRPQYQPPPTVLPSPPPPAAPSSERAGASGRTDTVAGAALRRLVEGAAASERRVDSLIAAASSGKTFSPAELLALQSTVFRYSQTIEILSRGTDRLVGAVKQTLQTQV